jgi:hypothetical protein
VQKAYAEELATASRSLAAQQADHAAQQAGHAADNPLLAERWAVAAVPQANQARSGGGGDAYTRSLERRIEALEQRLLEHDRVAQPVPPPTVYYARPGSGARIVRPDSSGGVTGYYDLHAMPERLEIEDAPEPSELPEPIQEPREPSVRGGVVYTTPEGRTRVIRPPAAVGLPSTPRSAAPPAPRGNPRAFEPAEPRIYALPREGRASGDLSEVTRLIEEMRGQVAELQRDLEALRGDLSRVRASRGTGAR